MTPATCHPGRPMYARGLCRACYGRARRAGALTSYPLTWPGEEPAPVCVCPVARPDRVGQCAGCLRVVTEGWPPVWRARIAAALPELADQRVEPQEAAQ